MSIRNAKAFGLMLLCAAATSVAAAQTHELWYERPAAGTIDGWERESLPIGNGWFGVSVFGGIAEERLQVTENSVLTENNLTDALEIRIAFTGHDPAKATGYRRSLELETGLARVRYEIDDVTYSRETFASYPDRVMAVRLAASKKGFLDFSLSAEVPFQKPFGEGAAARVGRKGEVRAEGSAIEITQHLQFYDVRFFGRIEAETDGRLEATGGRINVRGATFAVLYFSCGTNYEASPETFAKHKALGDDPKRRVVDAVAAAKKEGWESLRKRHVSDFGGMMGRVALSLPSDAADRNVPTDTLLAEYGKGRASAWLEETYFQYGRYLLVSSSRPGTMPANLQGVWTAHEKSPWGSGYWHNINVQMNYWPAFVCNLAECFVPYAEFNAAFRPVTRNTARGYLAAHKLGPVPGDGEAPDIWCVGTAVYPYVVCGGPGGHSGPGTGGLTTKLFADWWEFTRDREALRRWIWPTVHGMADFLQRCVKDFDGKMLSAFSASPEQMATGVEDTWWKDPANRGKPKPYYTTVGCAFDQMMIWETARDLLMLADALGTNDAVVATARADIGKYDPVQIGESGQIKEFREEKKYGDIGQYHHRHISQLVGLYPGTLITHDRPELIAAAKVSLTERGDESTGWALAHRLNCWARTGDGNHCHLLIRNLLGKRTNANLWDMHPPFQIDGNFGATAGIAEMLLQSHAGRIDILPALPDAWKSCGSFTGLVARGGYEIDCEWKGGRPVRVSVRSRDGSRPDVRFAGERVQY